MAVFLLTLSGKPFLICFCLVDSFPDGHLKNYIRCVFSFRARHQQQHKSQRIQALRKERTHVKETVKWNLCLRPRKVMKDCPGKLRVVISQYGFSYSPAGHSHIKPPASRFTHLPPFLHTPGTHRPDEALTSQWSPTGGIHRKRHVQVNRAASLATFGCCNINFFEIKKIFAYANRSLLMPALLTLFYKSTRLSAVLNEDGSAVWMNNDLSSHIPPIDYRSIAPARRTIILQSENESNSSDLNPLVATRRFWVQVERMHKRCTSHTARALDCNTRLGPETLAVQKKKVLFGELVWESKGLWTRRANSLAIFGQKAEERGWGEVKSTGKRIRGEIFFALMWWVRCLNKGAVTLHGHLLHSRSY